MRYNDRTPPVRFGALGCVLLVLVVGLLLGVPVAAGRGSIAVPSRGTAPALNNSRVSRSVVGAGKHAAAHRPAPALQPAHGTLLHSLAPASNPNHKAELGGRVNFGPNHKGAGRLLIPPPSAAHASAARGFNPTSLSTSTQLDNFSAQCGFGANETTIVQSTTNPSLLVAGANTYYNNSGVCQDSHAGVYYSSDGGQRWQFEVMPNLLFPSSGDPVVTFDPVRQVFVFAFVEFNRHDDAAGRIGVEVSSDGVNWSRNTTLDSNTATHTTDKPSIAVDQNPSSSHYGRVLVAWTQFFGNNAVYQTAYTDDGGVSWTGGDAAVNKTTHECGNGTSAAFDANGDVMVAWADCTSGTNSIYEELSADGHTWSTGTDKQITTTSPIEGAEQNTAANCLLKNGGSSFRCNSFPSLAGDPNAGDAGGTAFVISWADERSTMQNSQTATVAQIMALSTTDGGSTWDHLDYMNLVDFGDKFFPAASFSPSGRLTVSYSSREGDASSGNPNGLQFNEHQTEASSLTSLRSASYGTYTTDATLGNAGSLSFIGDYAGNTSLDQNFDTFPIWTDLRNGFPSIRTQDLCYSDCMTFLSPDVPLIPFETSGSTFTDFYSFSMDPTTGSGSNFWNVVGLRLGADGTSVDDDTLLAPNRYFSTSLATSSSSPPRNDYLVVNGNSGHAPNAAYFPQVHSFSSLGGPYSIEWDAGHIVLGSFVAGNMDVFDVARVYDSFLSSGITYHFGLRPDTGNTSNYSLTLHSASTGSYQGRSAAVADSGGVLPGSPAFIQYGTAGDPAQFDGLVVLNNNGGSGSYTLYRDTVAPTGTVVIDGGAATTSSTALNLTLSATNPTTGDPVSDMAFSVNGAPFGAFQPFSTSTTVSAPAGLGIKTVSVEYRNGAGLVSTSASDTIKLVPPPPGKAKLGRPTVHGTAARVKVKCTGSSGAICRMTLTLTVVETLNGKRVIAITAAGSGARLKRKTVVLGKTTMTVNAGRTMTLRVGLNRRGRRLLAARHKIKATLTISQLGKTLAKSTVTFNSPKKKRKH